MFSFNVFLCSILCTGTFAVHGNRSRSLAICGDYFKSSLLFHDISPVCILLIDSIKHFIFILNGCKHWFFQKRTAARLCPADKVGLLLVCLLLNGVQTRVLLLKGVHLCFCGEGDIVFPRVSFRVGTCWGTYGELGAITKCMISYVDNTRGHRHHCQVITPPKCFAANIGHAFRDRHARKATAKPECFITNT